MVDVGCVDGCGAMRLRELSDSDSRQHDSPGLIPSFVRACFDARCMADNAHCDCRMHDTQAAGPE
jgi:hypothetical protein